jgi:hypothetical protein
MIGQNSQSMTPYTDPFYEFRKLIMFGMMFLAIFSTTLIVFMRHRFGERYLNSYTYVLSFILILLASVFGASLAEGTKLEESASSGFGWLLFYAWAFLLLGAWHNIAARLRRRRGEAWHSYCPGDSHLLKILPFNRYVVHRYVEPAVGALIGLIVGEVLSAPLGGFILWSAFALFLVEAASARQWNNMMLDAMDQRIAQENLTAALAGDAPLRETQGFTVVGAEILNPETRSKLASASSRLDPELQDLLGAQKA